MHASQFASTAYAAIQPSIKSARSIEYDAFARVTTAILEAGSNPRNVLQRVRALTDNIKLWTVLAKDLADDQNALPDELRASLISLAGFSIRHSQKAMSRDGDLAPLVEINRAILRGLDPEGCIA